MRVHDMAMAEADRRINALGEVKAEAFDVPRADSVDLWIDKRCYIFFPKAVANTIVFDLKPTEAYPAGCRFVWEMQVWGLTPGKHMTPCAGGTPSPRVPIRPWLTSRCGAT